MSASPDGSLADPQQIIADLRRQLCASNAERHEALAREAAMGEVLRVINSSPGGLAPVFAVMIEKAMALCGAAFGVLNIHDGEAFRPVADRGMVDRGEQALRGRAGTVQIWTGRPAGSLD